MADWKYTVDEYVQDIISVFKENADENKAVPMKKYMRDQFDFFGIQTGPRRKLSRNFLKNRPPKKYLEIIVKKLWVRPERECQYFATELVEKYISQFEPSDISLLEYMICEKSWWDTVDMIAKKLVGSYLLKFPHLQDEYLSKWIASDNIWLKRSAILFQLGYKEKTDEKLLYKIINLLKDSDEFFIQKAIGWALREYSKVNPAGVKEFITSNDLPPLSRREGMKLMDK